VGSENPPLRLAVIGCGRVVEQCHLPALRTFAGLEVAALVDSDPDRLDRVAGGLGVRRRYRDYREMLNDGAVDVVAVCAPPHLHAEIGLAVLDAGKHLFLEKPLALSLADADRLVERAAAARGKALAGFNLRWHRLVRLAQHVIDNGELGLPATMHTEFTSATAFPAEGSAWRRQHDLGGGVLFDLGIHHFDLWRFLMRCEVEEVFAHRQADGGEVECVTVNATMANGALVTASFSHGVSDTNELEVHGRKARLRLSCYRFDSLHVDHNTAPRGPMHDWLAAMGRALRIVPQAAGRLLRGGDVIASYRAEWQHFIDVIRNGAPVQCGFEDARSALQITLAAIESASCGQPVRVARAAGAIAPLAAPAQVRHAAG
jgi:myo-inositol 2-dehydrogenase / D-chiro-inositol 1-dehydrogenase